MTDEQFQAMLDIHTIVPVPRDPRGRPALARGRQGRAPRARRSSARSSTSPRSRARWATPARPTTRPRKAGVIGLTKTVAKEWGRFKINCNAVAFGFVETRLTAADASSGATVDIEGKKLRVGMNPDLLKSHAQRCPLGRAGTVDEAAGAIYMYCTPDSDYITGEVVRVGGGA